MNRYSAFGLLRGALNGQKHWQPAWRDPEPKAHYDIVIIGGGGHGLATAYYLAKVHGLKNIAVLEKGWIGGGNTGRNTTIVRSNYRQKPLHDLFEFGLKLWHNLSDELNYNVMFSPRGAMFLGHSDADMVKLAERGDAMRCDGIDADLMTRDEVAKLEPLLDMSRSARFPIEGGLIQRRGGTARHDAVAWGYARGADSFGVDIIQKCEVTGFVRDGDAVVGVETTRGRIGAGRVGICVAGHSGHVAGLAGLKLPVESQTLQAMVTEGVKPMINSVIMSQSLHCYISQSDKGGIVFGGDPDNWPSYAQRGHPMVMEGAIAQGLALVPALSRLRMVRTWSGVTDMSFDGAPIIGETPVRNLYLNGGWCYGGFKATPASGWTYAHTLATGSPHALNAPFALERFMRGATIDETGTGPMPNSR
ncbi:sarcosine oxidase subunit beta family protein [Sphingorhabdus sp. IMCC26285]|uniref:Sarcosine oxidase subunit beta n=1 Tax=Sphingorhabdus profundilacus TaxID=2509718 RepID=A0A6I4LWU2_9SPHN|nr:sarcosine oxidase subunit beta family protein [Sphingorhabdus profundilacus]MVZ96536.1 sarcosine oxidase subunit beta family protein [Sphingorhabdus profundilacus]